MKRKAGFVARIEGRSIESIYDAFRRAEQLGLLALIAEDYEYNDWIVPTGRGNERRTGYKIFGENWNVPNVAYLIVYNDDTFKIIAPATRRRGHALAV